MTVMSDACEDGVMIDRINSRAVNELAERPVV
jgi:hypothetical protein